MQLNEPFKITPRLLPGLRIGDAWLHLEWAKRPGDGGRMRYQWTIDLEDGSEFTGDDLQTGAGGGTLQDGFSSLLGFLGAAADSYAYQMRTGRAGETMDLFPAPVVEWAYQNSEEITLLEMEIEDTPDLITP